MELVFLWPFIWNPKWRLLKILWHEISHHQKIKKLSERQGYVIQFDKLTRKLGVDVLDFAVEIDKTLQIYNRNGKEMERNCSFLGIYNISHHQNFPHLWYIKEYILRNLISLIKWWGHVLVSEIFTNMYPFSQ